MGFENLFFKKEHNASEESEEEIDQSKRNFLAGSAALVAASAVPFTSIEASEVMDVVDQVRMYETKIALNRERLADEHTSLKEIHEIIFSDLPPLSQESLRGTELDRTEFLRKSGSLPATFVGIPPGNGMPTFRWLGDNENIRYFDGREGNAFVVKAQGKEILISNEHILGSVPFCHELGGSADIAGCLIDDHREYIEAQSLEHLNDTALEWSADNTSDRLDGTLVHVPATRSKKAPLVDVYHENMLSGVPIKVTPNLIWSRDNPERQTFFSEKQVKEMEQVSERFVDILRHSYFMYVSPEDLNYDHKQNFKDIAGTSGAPVITDFSCAEGKRTPHGILWATLKITDPDDPNRTYAIALIQGPEVIDGLVTELVGEIENVDKKTATIKIQEALNEWRRNRNTKEIVADGVYGKGTAAAVFAFQLRTFGKENLSNPYTPGLVDERTWYALFPTEPFPAQIDFVGQ